MAALAEANAALSQPNRAVTTIAELERALKIAATEHEDMFRRLNERLDRALQAVRHTLVMALIEHSAAEALP